jgi:hypothetical protein
MTFWTPEGEHRVPTEETADPGRPPAESAEAGLDDPMLDPEARAQAEALAGEMAEVRRQLLSVPAAVVVANHAMGLYELAAIHLGNQPPNLSEAQVAIDAFSALVDAVGDRLGPDGTTMREALAQIRLAYVQIKAGTDGEAEPPTDA